MCIESNKGLTLIELLIVLVLVGVLAATALPRFVGKAGAEEITLQDQLVAVLRLMQNRAMQQTNPGSCHQVLFTAVQVGSAATNPCTPTSDFSSQQQNDADQLRLSDTKISLSLFNASSGGIELNSPFRFRFNSLGQPVSDSRPSTRFENGLRINMAGSINAPVCIESEGYIHPCD